MRTPIHTVFLSLLSVLVFSPSVLAAPLSSARDDSPEFKDATHALKMDDRATAYILFTERWAKAPSFDVAVLLGQTELLLEKYRDAAEHLSLAVRDFPSTEPPKKLDGIKASLEKARAKVGAVKLTVDQADAEVTIDGKAVGKSPFDVDLYVDPGNHTIKAMHSSLGAGESKIDIKAGEQQSVELRLAKPAEAAPPAKLPYSSAELDFPSQPKVSEPPKPEPTSGIETKTIVLIGGAIVAVGTVGTGVYFHLKGNQHDDDAKKIRGGGLNCTGSTSADCIALRHAVDDRGHSYTTAKVLYGVGAAVAVTTGVLALVLPSRKRTEGATNVNAWVGPGVAGLVASGDF